MSSIGPARDGVLHIIGSVPELRLKRPLRVVGLSASLDDLLVGAVDADTLEGSLAHVQGLWLVHSQ